MTVRNSNGNGFLPKFQSVASIIGVLFVMVATVAGLGYSNLADRISRIENNRLTAGEFVQYKERIDGEIKARASRDAMAGEVRRMDDRFNEFKARTEKTFDERRDDIGNLRKELGGSANLRDALTDLKRMQDEQQRQILDIIRTMGTKRE